MKNNTIQTKRRKKILKNAHKNSKQTKKSLSLCSLLPKEKQKDIAEAIENEIIEQTNERKKKKKLKQNKRTHAISLNWNNRRIYAWLICDWCF